MRKRWTMLVTLAIAFALGGVTVGAIAVLRATPVITRLGAGPVTKVALAQSNDVQTITNTNDQWVKLTGAAVNLKVPNGQHAVLIATFSANTKCSSINGFTFDECDLRIMVDGAQMGPGPVGPNDGAAFDSQGAGDDYLEMHAVQRARLVGPGRHTVQVEVRAASTPFQLDAWQLTVESAQAA